MKLLSKAEQQRVSQLISELKATSWELLAENASLRADNENLRKKLNQVQRRLKAPR